MLEFNLHLNFRISDDETNKTVRRFVANWENHYTFELNEGYKTVAKFEFNTYLRPQISCTGTWDDVNLFNAAIITSNSMQIHIMNAEHESWSYYTFVRDIDALDMEPAAWQDKLFGFAFLGITMLGGWGVVKCVQKRIDKANLEEAQRILKEEEEAEKKKNKKKND